MAEFKKGQLVAVNSPEEDDRQWHLRIFKRKRPDGHYVVADDKGKDWAWQLCLPAEEVWPEIFLGWERRAGEQAAEAVAMESELVQRLRRQVAWLCQELGHSDDLCPTFLMTAPCDHDCPRCWEEASLKVVEEEQC
jgi:hypothetical protein